MVSSPLFVFGTKKYPWGNMPALDVMNLKSNEDDAENEREYSLLFAASGGLRNVIKSVVGLPENHRGKCVNVINDRKFLIVARNIIMLFIALSLNAETAVPMIIHLWYSAWLPRSMVEALQSNILPLIEEVCKKIEGKSAGSVQ